MGKLLSTHISEDDKGIFMIILQLLNSQGAQSIITFRIKIYQKVVGLDVRCAGGAKDDGSK